jgi:hypothetical protein
MGWGLWRQSKVIRTVKLPGVVALEASVPINEGEEEATFTTCPFGDYDPVSRVALADVSGHGNE